MNKLIKPIALFLTALLIVGGGGYWWFNRAPLTAEFIAILPDQAYIDWETDKLPTVDQNNDHIADALLIAAADNLSDQLPIIVSLTYDNQAKSAVKQLEKILSNQPIKFYPSASVVAVTTDLSTIRQIARLNGVVMVEEDIDVVGLSRAVATYPVSYNSPIQAAGIALVDGGTSYTVAHRQLLVNSAGAGLNHGNVVAANLLQVDPNAKIIDVTVLDETAQAPVSRLIEGVDWTIANKNRYDIATINVSAGYTGEANFAFNRALSAAAADGLAVVVSVANDTWSGQVAAKVPGMVRVSSYESVQRPPTSYDKTWVDVLTPADDRAGASAAAGKLSGAVSQLIANSDKSSPGKVNSPDWWTTLSTTVINIDDVITLTDEQLLGITNGDQQSIDEFMRPLSQYLQEALTHLETELDGGEDSQLLRELLGSVLGLTGPSIYGTDLNFGEYSQAEIEDFWDELWGDLGE
ncbi:hypothetical protein JXA59_01520 [Patescibacteria group bacterium]|nr:hypothetical protein [Patescibacteria group bacterium]